MTRLWVLVVAPCLALTAATSMDDGYYGGGETYLDVRQPRNYYPYNTWDSESYPRDQPYDRTGDQNGLQLEFNGNLKVYGKDVKRRTFSQVGKLYDTLTGYDGHDGGYGVYDGRDGGYDGAYAAYDGRDGGYGRGYAVYDGRDGGYDGGYAAYDGRDGGYDGGYAAYDGRDAGYDGGYAVYDSRDGGYDGEYGVYDSRDGGFWDSEGGY
ncbi:uncharacterized protein [Haliotis asinina]|uniref:uncharacterized protein n=1 Tax=Haliotis asinina TaxID=109174 RepID=UPI0035327A3E